MTLTVRMGLGPSAACHTPERWRWEQAPTVRMGLGPSAMLNYRAHRGGSKPPPYGWARGLPSKAFVQPICSPCGTRIRVGGIRQRQAFSGRGSVSVPAQNNHEFAVGRGLAPAEACQSNQTPNVGAHTHGYPAPTESTFPANTRCRVTPWLTAIQQTQCLQGWFPKFFLRSEMSYLIDKSFNNHPK